MSDDSMMSAGDKPVTRSELREEFAAHRVEITREIASAMNYVVERNQAAIESAIAAAEVRIEARQASFGEALEAGVRRVMQDGFERFRGEFDRFAAQMSRDVSRMALAVAEAIRQEITVIDDQYRDLPGRMSLLERELDDHRRDRAVHLAPRPRRPRR